MYDPPGQYTVPSAVIAGDPKAGPVSRYALSRLPNDDTWYSVPFVEANQMESSKEIAIDPT